MNLNEYLSGTSVIAKQFAVKIGVPAPLISQWRNNVRPVPIERCAAIEKATSGLVTRRDLRPDDWHLIWPELQQQEAA